MAAASASSSTTVLGWNMGNSGVVGGGSAVGVGVGVGVGGGMTTPLSLLLVPSSLGRFDRVGLSPCLGAIRTKPTKLDRLRSKQSKKRMKLLKLKRVNKYELYRKKKKEQQTTLQMQTWASFQRKIAVQGFDTGQILQAKAVKRNRGGKGARRKAQRELVRRQAMVNKTKVVVTKVNEIRAGRWSELVTQALLKEAYDGLPKRTGPRRTKYHRRQARRWRLVREIRAKLKQGLIRAHLARSQRQSRMVQAVLATKAQAPQQRATEETYQLQTLQRWTQQMTRGRGEDDDDNDNDDNNNRFYHPPSGTIIDAKVKRTTTYTAN